MSSTGGGPSCHWSLTEPLYCKSGAADHAHDLRKQGVNTAGDCAAALAREIPAWDPMLSMRYSRHLAMSQHAGPASRICEDFTVELSRAALRYANHRS